MRTTIFAIATALLTITLLPQASAGHCPDEPYADKVTCEAAEAAGPVIRIGEATIVYGEDITCYIIERTIGGRCDIVSSAYRGVLQSISMY